MQTFPPALPGGIQSRTHPPSLQRKPSWCPRWSLGRRWTASVVAMILSLACLTAPIRGQESSASKYSEAVVGKAEEILGNVGLRQSGRSLQATETAEINRAISGLAREKRELRRIHKEWQVVADRIGVIRSELQRLNQQHGELGFQLARVAGVDVAANNRIVGLLKASDAQMKALVDERERLKDELSKRRAALNDAETAYAETVLAIREEYTDVRDKLTAALNDEEVKIALKVMSTNRETPEEVTADQILAVLDKRIERIEQEIFRETIPLVVEQRSMYVDVVVGRKTTRMVVDSGATMICLPQKIAAELEVIVPVDARDMQLVLADGRAIPAKGVVLPRVRVGEFEAENVDAAVLDASASDAEPLLGMSFLGNFKFELDPAQRTLKLLRVRSE